MSLREMEEEEKERSGREEVEELKGERGREVEKSVVKEGLGMWREKWEELMKE